jgi:hypothetical protein
MKQDKRIGAGHWRGCHTFTDIVCDGTMDGWSPGRDGGLKMGGTYWYYVCLIVYPLFLLPRIVSGSGLSNAGNQYRLDGDVESYNETEPITTLCPLLPGQPVNVLHVPIVLPDSNSQHKRDGSVSSQKSDIRTMDPQDKYMNPRTPPRPKPPRLKTSPPLFQDCSWSSLLGSPLNVIGDRSVSQPVSATDSPKYHIAPKPKAARSVSPPKSRGLRAAFRHLAVTQPLGIAPEERHRGRPVARTNEIDSLAARSGGSHDDCIDTSNASSDYSSRVTSPEDSDIEGLGIERLPFRCPAMEKDSSTSAPIWSRRASKLGRRDPSPLSTYLKLDGPSQEIKCSSSSTSNTKVLEPLGEVSPLAMDASIPDGHPNSIPVNHMEKRLPTLPNSPSSVMDEELRVMDAMNRVLDMEVLRSHFSDSTSIDDSVTLAGSTDEKSRFSKWSTDTELVSPASMTSSSTLNNDSQSCSPSGDAIAGPPLSSPRFQTSSSGPVTPTLNLVAGSFSPVTVAHQSPVLPSSARTSSLRTSDPLSISEEDLGDLESNSKRHAAMFPGLKGIDRYGLFPTGSPMARPISRHNDSALNTPVAARKRDLDSEQFDSGVVFHSRAMRELIDELSYLGGMIQTG